MAHLENLQKLLKYLKDGEYVSAGYLSRQTEVTERTIYNRIKDLDALLGKNGAHVETKPRYGIRLVVTDRNAYQNFLEKDFSAVNEIPDTASDRENFVLAFLLNHNEYIKLDDMCEFMYISKGTLSATLKRVEYCLKQYNLAIMRKPNYGIRAVGEEFDFRRCITDLFIKRNMLQQSAQEHKEKGMQELAEIVLELLKVYDVKFSETAFENFVVYMYVAVKRIPRGNTVNLSRDQIQNITQEEWSFVEKLSDVFSEKYGIAYPEAEKAYIALHLAGKRMIGSNNDDAPNFVVRSDLDQLVLKMLDMVYCEYHIDLRNAFDFRVAMNQHLVPFDIRMHFNIPLKNPLLEDIKNNYMIAYQMAASSSAVLAEYYKKEIPEDEIGYLALLFALALEQNSDNTKRRLNVLLVCASGKGSARLMKYHYQRAFQDYLNEIAVCDLYELKHYDFAHVDCVFTTVPIAHHVPVPVMEVSLFPSESEIRNLKRTLHYSKNNFLNKYYKPDHFYIDISGDDRTEILTELCERVIREQGITEEFTELVLQREELNSTDFGNFVALPHPMKMVTEYTFVYVAVLERPVRWNRHDVQVLFLTSIGKKEDPDIQRFYEMTMELIVDEKAIADLIRTRSFGTLMEGFEKQLE